MINRTSLVFKILSKGHDLSIVEGRLDIRSISRKPVPSDWLKKKKDQIIRELAVMLGIDLLVYVDYSTGCFDNRYPGVNLQFQWILSLEGGYVNFNADLKRARSSESGKKGTPLPKGRFIVGKMNKFLKFWARTGLKLPPRLSSFHDYMGNLKQLIFVADIIDGEKLDKDSIEPFNISASKVSERFRELTDNIHTTRKQSTYNTQTRFPDKRSSESPNTTDLEKDSATGSFNYGIRSTGNASIRDNINLSKPSKKPPPEQTIDEWRADYDKGDLH